jgi:hypothetical protein
VITSDIDGLDGSLNDGLTRRRHKPGTAFRDPTTDQFREQSAIVRYIDEGEPPNVQPSLAENDACHDG